MAGLLPVFLVRDTVEKERFGEWVFVAANTEQEAWDLAIGIFDYDGVPEHVKKTKMLFNGLPQILEHIYLD